MWQYFIHPVDRSFTSSSSLFLLHVLDGSSTADCPTMTTTLSPVTQGESAMSTIDIISTGESATLNTNDIIGIVAAWRGYPYPAGATNHWYSANYYQVRFD